MTSASHIAATAPPPPAHSTSACLRFQENPPHWISGQDLRSGAFIWQRRTGPEQDWPQIPAVHDLGGSRGRAPDTASDLFDANGMMAHQAHEGGGELARPSSRL